MKMTRSACTELLISLVTRIVSGVFRTVKSLFVCTCVPLQLCSTLCEKKKRVPMYECAVVCCGQCKSTHTSLSIMFADHHVFTLLLRSLCCTALTRHFQYTASRTHFPNLLSMQTSFIDVFHARLMYDTHVITAHMMRACARA
jgi:hypothetical protein